MWLALAHPEIDARSCDDCERWLYDEDGKRSERAGAPVPRLPGMPTPCHKCPKIPRGKPPRRESAVQLTDRNRRAYLHYLECRATGRFPDDALVARHAAIIRSVHDEWDRVPLRRLLAVLGRGGGV